MALGGLTMAEYIKLEAAVDAVNDVYYDTPDMNLSADKLEAALRGLPAANMRLKPCRYCFDGNCTKRVEYDRCEYRKYKNLYDVHGIWIPFYESEVTGWNPEFAGRDPIAGYECSNCNEEATLDCDNEFVLSKFCPNCGARMDLEVL